MGLTRPTRCWMPARRWSWPRPGPGSRELLHHASMVAGSVTAVDGDELDENAKAAGPGDGLGFAAMTGAVVDVATKTVGTVAGTAAAGATGAVSAGAKVASGSVKAASALTSTAVGAVGAVGGAVVGAVTGAAGAKANERDAPVDEAEPAPDDPDPVAEVIDRTDLEPETRDV